MLKTKLFSDIDPQSFENTLNEFIKDKEVVDIHYRTFPIQTAWQNGAPTKGEVVDRVLVVYKEAEEKEEESGKDISLTRWLTAYDFNANRLIKCVNCGHTLDFSLLGNKLPAACPRCHAITEY